MGWFADQGGSFGINLGINPAEWFGEDRADEVRAENINQQKEFAQNTIQWRVADAKAAGLHPLFGLQGNNATFSPNPVTVNDSTSISMAPGPEARSPASRGADQQLADAQAMAEREQQDRHARTISGIATDTEQQNLLRAQADLVRQQIADSLKARAAGHGAVNKERTVVRPNPVNPEDAYEVKPRPIMQGTQSSGGAIAVGPAAAGFEPVWIAPGIPALVPAGSAANLGDMEFTGWLVAAGATALWWGDSAMQEVIDRARRVGHYLNSAQVQEKAAQIMRQLKTQDSGGGAP